MDQIILPAILITGYDGSEACAAIASGMLQRGFPVVAACAGGDPSAVESARAAGCAVVEADECNALRAGLEFCRANMTGLSGVVAADAGQGYSLLDVLAVATVSAANPDMVIVASRKAGKDIEWPSRVERGLAGLAFSVVHGRHVSDPWAGLIGLPAARMEEFLKEKGNGAAYRFRLLLTLQHHGIKAASVPVSAGYAREPGTTAGSRLLDLFRIVLVPLMFVASSLTLTGADYLMRFLFYYVILRGNEPVSLAVGFYTGAFVGYLINRNVVFRGKKGGIAKEFGTIVKYAILTTCNYYLAHLLISLFMGSLHLAFPVASIIASVLLYAPNFLAQRELVFRNIRKQYA